jgi:hypothetical protein
MPRETTFHIVLVRPAHGTGETPINTPDQTITYTGSEMSVKIP